MVGASKHGFIATVTLPDGSSGGLLDLRCRTREVAESAEFRELARTICRLLAEHSPRYLELGHVPAREADRILRECRVEALRRGIPDDDVEAWAAQAAERRIASLCLLELPLGSGTVARALEEFGHPVAVRRFYRASLDD